MNPANLMPPGSTPMFWLCVIATFGFWLVAYLLIIKRSFADRTFGMPVAALCCNMAWELLLSTVFASEYLLIHLGNILWLAFDGVILVAMVRFGRRDFEPSILTRNFGLVIVAGVAMATFVQYLFMVEFNDEHGYFVGWACALLMSVLFSAMLIRRKSLHGQSPMIAGAMLLGNVSAYFWIINHPLEIPLRETVKGMLACTLVFNLLYLILTLKQRATADAEAPREPA